MVKGEDKEQALLQQIINRNGLAIRRFYTLYAGYLTTVCSRYISDKEDIKDILQESFIKIFKAIANFKYRGPGSLKAWSARIVVNEALKFLKTKQKLLIISKPVWDLPEIPDEDPDFEEIPTSVILEMIRSLPVGYRTVFNLYVFERKSHKEIASILKITENTSASQLHRAKSFLAKQIRNYKLNKVEL